MGCMHSNNAASAGSKSKSATTLANKAASNSATTSAGNSAALPLPATKMSASAFDSVIVRTDPEPTNAHHHKHTPHQHGDLLSPQSAASTHQQQQQQQDEAIALASQPTSSSSGSDAFSFFSKDVTHRPIKLQPNSKLNNTIKATMRATLGGGDLRAAVALPPGEDQNEWISISSQLVNQGMHKGSSSTSSSSSSGAHHCNVQTSGMSLLSDQHCAQTQTIHFFNAATMIFATISRFCTTESCPVMSAGRAEFLWKDSTPQYKKATKVTAQTYIQLTLAACDETLNDQTQFPIDEGAKFPRNFMSTVKTIYKRLFRLYAHIYCSHSEHVKSIGASAHLNSLFKHFIYFAREFDLLDRQEEAPLQSLIVRMFANDQENQQAAQPK